jgi:hypothetical protein
MNAFWNRIFNLDEELSIWVDEKDLGQEKVLFQHKKQYYVRIPQKIDHHITLRLKGLGKTLFRSKGNLYLHVWLNKGVDASACLWLSETAALKGTDKRVHTGEKVIIMVVPPRCRDGLTIRLKGYGKEPPGGPHAPVAGQKKRGNLLVRLIVFPDLVTPRYGSFDALSTENMALEGWVYRKVDEVIQRLGRSALPAAGLAAEALADRFNESGWRGVSTVLLAHLKLAHLPIEFDSSASMELPGSCEGIPATTQTAPIRYRYKITINERFLDNPFSVAAVLAHELCHVVHWEKIGPPSGKSMSAQEKEKATLEVERTVDLLVFLFKLGEFQLRVARDKRLTIGYFNQEVFERMQGIVARKMSGGS